MKKILYVVTIIMVFMLSISCSVFDMVFAPVEGYDREGDPIIYEGEYGELFSTFRDIPYETVTIEAFDGVTLYARYYEVSEGAPLEIQCHGYKGSPVSNLAGENLIARTAGRNTLCLEMRAMGRSGGKAITFGVNESRDVVSWCRWANERFGDDKPIVLYGISMGAASVLMASALPELPDNVMAIIADCPYSDQLEELVHIGKSEHIPGWMIPGLVKRAARNKGDFDLVERTPIEAVQQTDLPVLIIHGEADTFVPVTMSYDMKRANPDIQLEIFPGAEHGYSYIVDPERYEILVNDMWERCVTYEQYLTE